jgi:hypothetical protein
MFHLFDTTCNVPIEEFHASNLNRCAVIVCCRHWQIPQNVYLLLSTGGLPPEFEIQLWCPLVHLTSFTLYRNMWALQGMLATEDCRVNLFIHILPFVIIEMKQIC